MSYPRNPEQPELSIREANLFKAIYAMQATERHSLGDFIERASPAYEERASNCIASYIKNQIKFNEGILIGRESRKICEQVLGKILGMDASTILEKMDALVALTPDELEALPTEQSWRPKLTKGSWLSVKPDFIQAALGGSIKNIELGDYLYNKIEARKTGFRDFQFSGVFVNYARQRAIHGSEMPTDHPIRTRLNNMLQRMESLTPEESAAVLKSIDTAIDTAIANGAINLEKLAASRV